MSATCSQILRKKMSTYKMCVHILLLILYNTYTKKRIMQIKNINSKAILLQLKKILMLGESR